MFINAENINKTRSSIKLDYRNIGSYRVKEMLLPLIYKLKLLVLVRIYSYFYTNLLELIVIDPMIN